jgi:membrane dipeptidase
VEDYIDHIDYIRNLVGIEYVGMSLDYWEGMAGVASVDEAQILYNYFLKSGRWKKESYLSPPWWYPEGIEEPSQLPNLTKALVKRGYTEQEIKLVMGGNFIRVYKEVWATTNK